MDKPSDALRTGTLFPPHPYYSGFDAPARVEADVYELEVEGALPLDLKGAFYRVAPEPQFPPRLGEDIVINGDGMVSRFLFGDGHVDFKSRYVHTEKFLLERAARRSLFGAYRNPYTDEISARGLERGTANTNVLWHGGRLLVLKEDSRPVELDPVTLETRGRLDFDGRLTSLTTTAHPKIDPLSGELIFFGYAAKGETTRDIAFYVADARGRIVREEWFQAPYAAEIHDFVVTRDHVIFPIMPTTTDLERLKAGGSHWLWDPTQCTQVGIFPRAGTVRELRWFKGPARWCFHYANAYQSAPGQIVVEGSVAKAQLFPFFYPDTQGGAFDPAQAVPRLTRWTFDLNSAKDDFTEELLWNVYSEFPRIDERFAMVPHRYTYLIGNDPSRDFEGGGLFGPAFNTIARYDRLSEQVDHYALDGHSTAQEPVFVPRSADAAEGDGYLLVLVNRHQQMLNELLVLDAQRLADGPIASVRIPVRLRNGVHGNWVPAHFLTR